jgi:hypothetical protein
MTSINSLGSRQRARAGRIEQILGQRDDLPIDLISSNISLASSRGILELISVITEIRDPLSRPAYESVHRRNTSILFLGYWSA